MTPSEEGKVGGCMCLVGGVIVPKPAGAAMHSRANSNTRMLTGQRP